MTYKTPKTDPNTWTVAEAKSRFSAVVRRARSAGPQAITRHGRKEAVVVSSEEWDRKTKRTGTLAQFLLASPLRGSGLEAPREPDGVRDIDL